jgi:ligand-binding sensor domain-containing protein/DNA-binding CsgD family transcriptional regulator
MKGSRYLFLLIFLFLLSNRIVADEIKSIGVPYIQNYSKAVYLSGNQNWSIAKDRNGIMYFGNAQGLLTYDGKYWQQFEMPNKQIVRSVATDPSGKVYTGSFGEFGYWRTIGGRFKYTSLVPIIPKPYKITDEIWKIYIDGKRTIFQSFSSIFIYEHHKIKVIKSVSPYLFLHKAGQRFIIEDLEKGLFELKGSKLVALPNAGPEKPSSVLSILPFKNGTLLICTSKQGLYIYDGKKYIKFNSQASDFLKSYQLNNAIAILNKYYAFGTILNGLLIMDEDGNVVQKINKTSGLQNNTILSIFADQEQNLWTGLDNGIDRIELNDPLNYYFDKTGKFGTVYSSLIYKDNIYLGTNQGLFYSPWNGGNKKRYNSFDFKLIAKSQGQVWSLKEIDGQLLCGHNDGTFLVKGSAIEKVSTLSGGWTINKVDKDYLIQGTYTGLALFKKDALGIWRFFYKIDNFGAPSRYVEQDSKGDLWVSHAYKGLYRLTLSPDYKQVISTENYSERNGLPGSYGINIFKLGSKLIYSSRKGFFTYDEISNKFSSYGTLNKALGSFATSNKVINAGNNNYWFINNGKMSLVTFEKTGNIDVDSNRFSILDGRMVQYYENISKISNNMYLISVDDGFVIYDASNKNLDQNKTLPAVLIRKIEDITDTYSTLSENGDNGQPIQIPYNRDNLRIAFSLPYYRQAKIRYQYYLEGYSKKWSDWSSASQKDFTNLTSGDYTFLVRAEINNQTISKISTFKFTVGRPFYASNFAIILYLITLLGMIVLGKRWYAEKLLKHHQLISARLQVEKEEFLKHEAEATERHISKLQTEKLQAELAGKNRELANSAMSLVYKNELLQKISDEMLKLKDEQGKKLTEDQLRKIQKVIEEGMNDKRDWNLFENSFNEAHENFFKKLKSSLPDLVPNDLKLCAFLLLNMSSKEMASLLNITVRGVEIRRYRLRKKLNIPHDKNLVEFLMEL